MARGRKRSDLEAARPPGAQSGEGRPPPAPAQDASATERASASPAGSRAAGLAGCVCGVQNVSIPAAATARTATAATYASIVRGLACPARMVSHALTARVSASHSTGSWGTNLASACPNAPTAIPTYAQLAAMSAAISTSPSRLPHRARCAPRTASRNGAASTRRLVARIAAASAGVPARVACGSVEPASGGSAAPARAPSSVSASTAAAAVTNAWRLVSFAVTIG